VEPVLIAATARYVLTKASTGSGSSVEAGERPNCRLERVSVRAKSSAAAKQRRQTAPAAHNPKSGRTMVGTSKKCTRVYQPSIPSDLGRLKCCPSFGRGSNFASMPDPMHFIFAV
jgi:hypothetical protein